MDDESEQVLFIKMRLEANGYEVISASDGEQGLDLVRKSKPDVVLVDLVMPRMDGIEVCRRLKLDPETRQIPLILFTASSIRDLQELCKGFGIEACLRKPYETEELLKTIGLLLHSKT